MSPSDYTSRVRRLTEIISSDVDLSALPAAIRDDLDTLGQELGIDWPHFRSLSLATRRQYLAGFRRGETVADQKRHRAQRERVRRQQRKGFGITSDARWSDVIRLRDDLYGEGIDVIAGANTHTDDLDYEDLYSDESLIEHIKVYGYEYVLRHMHGQLDAIIEYNQSGGRKRTKGRTRMRRRFGSRVIKDLRASGAFPDVDERWYWYHTSHTITIGSHSWGSRTL